MQIILEGADGRSGFPRSELLGIDAPLRSSDDGLVLV